VNIPVVYEDDWLVIVDKPAGLLTIPTPKKEKRTLTSILNDDLAERKLPYRLHPCHRLDRETSGLIIYAKGKAAQKKTMELFHSRRVKKNYLAFVQGKFSRPEGEIKNPIEGQPASTHYRVVETRKDFVIVEVSPLTGRTNQIRIHFQQIGHPILGESKFAFRRDFKIKAKRLCLHAQKLDFPHPVTNKVLKINLDLAQDLKDFLTKNP
jgi:23S rRNA pseudouridine1911/1915/1917 synthase